MKIEMTPEEAAIAGKALDHYDAYLVSQRRWEPAVQELAERLKKQKR